MDMFYIRLLLFLFRRALGFLMQPVFRRSLAMSDTLTKCVLLKIFYKIIYLKVEKEIHNVNMGTVTKANRQSLGGSIFIHL